MNVPKDRLFYQISPNRFVDFRHAFSGQIYVIIDIEEIIQVVYDGENTSEGRFAFV